MKKSPGAVCLKLQQVLNRRRNRAAQILGAASEAFEVFFRKVHAAHFEVALHVANNVRQLKRKSQTLGEIGRAWIAEAEDVQAR